jgi:hypothetical protein
MTVERYIFATVNHSDIQRFSDSSRNHGDVKIKEQKDRVTVSSGGVESSAGRQDLL